MSDILKNREDLVRVKRSLEMIKAIGFNREAVEYALLNILPKTNKELMVRYRVRDWGGKPGYYIPYANVLDISVEKCQEFVVLNAKDLVEIYGVKDIDKFKNYLSLFILLREIERVNQYLIGQGKLEAPCKLVKDGYKSLSDVLVKPNCLVPHPIKDIRRSISLIQYHKKPNSYVLERNANVEGFNALRAVAYENKDEEMLQVFNDMTKTCLTIGYEEDAMGSFYHTFKDLRMMSEFKKINNTDGLSIDQRVFYGVDIDEEARDKVMLQAKGRTF